MVPFVPQSFFMFCRGQFSTKLTLPAAFLEKHGVDHGRVSLRLKTDPARRTWDVKIRKIDGVFYFVDGWSDFVADNYVRELNILLFHIVGDSAFEVSIYLEDSCLKIPSPPPTVDSPVGGDDDEGGRRWRFVKKLKDYVISDQRLDFPKKFAMGTGLAKKSEVELENEEGKRWTVAIKDRNRKMFSFSSGWTEFLEGNNLRDGEEETILVFEYARDEGVVKVVVMDEEEGEELLSSAAQGGLLEF